jgi:hypothetical protein
MKRQDKRDAIGAFRRLTDAAEKFVNRSPRVKRIQSERSALLDAISHAQLVLSLYRLPEDTRPSTEDSSSAKAKALNEERLKESQARFNELEHKLRPLVSELEELGIRAEKAKSLLDTALLSLDSVPFKRKAA